ncbi:preprotein translocase subunit SecG [Candidatus Saccharibacteria bacterium]|nr:preprotein translocase subunit SecG [Candidatus Saccharibacteria bacterium]
MSFEVVTPVITLVSAILLIITILLQQRGASLGAGFGSSGELFTARRGLDKNLFDATVILAVVFVLSILAGMIVPGLMA